MIFKFRFAEIGGHTHVVVFAGRSEGSLGKCGDLTFRNEEWPFFKGAIDDSWPDGSRVVLEDATGRV